jgi:hypothetical protein
MGIFGSVYQIAHFNNYIITYYKLNPANDINTHQLFLLLGFLCWMFIILLQLSGILCGIFAKTEIIYANFCIPSQGTGILVYMKSLLYGYDLSSPELTCGICLLSELTATARLIISNKSYNEYLSWKMRTTF